MDVVVVVGAGLIGQAIARRVGPGKKIILADLRQAHADAAVETFLNAGFDAEAATVDVASRVRCTPSPSVRRRPGTSGPSFTPRASRRRRRPSRRS